MLDDNFKPMKGSPCIGAGTYEGIVWDKDLSGKYYKDPPTLGCYEVYDTISSFPINLLPVGGGSGTQSKIDLIDNYIQDGLIMMLDGKYNVGRNMHADSLTASNPWLDLTGNGFNGIPNETALFNSSGFVADGFSYFTIANGLNLQELLSQSESGYTIQVCCQFIPNTGKYLTPIALGGTGNESTAFAWLYMNSNAYRSSLFTTSYGGSINSTLSLTLQYDKAASKASIWSLDSRLVNVAPTNINAPSGDSYIGRVVYSNSTVDYVLPQYCYIHAIRIYNRSLAGQEIVNNAFVDKIRYNITVRR
jgi:hypothetical protein